MLFGVCDELLRDHIQNGEAVLADRAELSVQTLLHELRQRVAVDALGLFGGDADEILLRAGNGRGKGAFGDGVAAVDFVRNQIREILLCMIMRRSVI